MSGIRVTGRLHLGHYFGALTNWLKYQDEADQGCFFGVMDWHGMTSAYKKTENLTAWTRELFAEVLAIGIDPARSTFFVQSWVPEHLELFMIFANLTPLGWLERVPTWKDAEEEMKLTDTHNLGRFGYPVLQTADIALYRATHVPVGGDQVSHIEISREIVRRFNHLYKGALIEPKVLVTETPSLPGLDGRKMSKSYDNGVDLFEEEKVLHKKIMGMPTDPARVRRTDPGDPEKCPVWKFHKLFSNADTQSWVVAGCTSAGIGCGDCKGKLLENMESFIGEPRRKKKDILQDQNRLVSIMKEGSEKASLEARKTLDQVRRAMKFTL